MQTDSKLFTSQLAQFLIKSAIIFVLFLVAVAVLIPDFSGLSSSLRKSLKEEKARMAVMSFIQNPAALYRASELDEKEGKFDNAVMEMQMAIGLLEMHGANQPVIKRYTTRLNQLSEKLKHANEGQTSQEAKAAMFNGKPVKRWKE